MVAPPRPGLDEVDLALTRAAVREGLFGEPPRPTKIGRFEVEGTAGLGGMGRVYVATDPNLQRRVALKLIAGTDDAEDAARLRERLVKEAQALASLNHPNVVVAYEVGTAAEDVFLAMEYAPGEDLRQWLRGSPSWPEVRDVFAQAGEGLAAAHDAGVIHRDFKPDNVLVGKDGRVRVLDFGLAVASDPAPTEGGQGRSRAGTPGYVAPEVLAGAPADARSDQFAFCRSLSDGLEKAGRAPTWLMAVAGRGLAENPADRHASMHALVAAMRRDPSARRRSIALVAGVVLLGGGLWGHARWTEARRAQECREASSAAAQVWDASARDQLRRAFAATDLASAGLATGAATVRLDEWVEQWRQARAGVCPSPSGGPTAPELREAARACLERAKTRLSVTVESLGEADRETVLAAVQLTSSLPPPSACVDDVTLRRSTASGEAPTLDEVAQIDRLLARSETRRLVGDGAEALALAERALASAQALEWAPLVVKARRQLGAAQLETGDHAASGRSLRRAYLHAAAIGRDDLGVETLSGLVTVERAQGRLGVARVWAELGLAQYERLGRRRSVDAAALLNAYAQVQFEENDFDAARVTHEEVLALRRELLGEGHPHVAATLIGLANLDDRAGRLPAALERYAQAEEVMARTMGPEHPLSLIIAGNQAAIALRQDRPEEAATGYERVLALRESLYGAGHRGSATVHLNLGSAYFRLGRLEDAGREFEAALEIQRRTLGPQHASVADTLNNLAALAFRRERPAEALAPVREAISIRAQARGEDDPELIAAWTNLAQIHTATEDLSAAAEALDEAARIADASLPPDDLRRQAVHVGRAELASRRGDPLAAIEHIERAIPLLRAAGRHPRVAELESHIARLRQQAHSEPE